jgi:hypothetical protein
VDLSNEARVIGDALRLRWPDAKFYVSTQPSCDDGRGLCDLVIIDWSDAPRCAPVREVAREAAGYSTHKKPGWKIAYRHRISRETRLKVRELILAQYPGYDYITEAGDLNPDAVWRYLAPPIVMPVDGLGDERTITCKDHDGNSLIKVVAYAILRREGKDV